MAMRKIFVWRGEAALQQGPVKTRSRILLASCRHMFMACNVRYRVVRYEGCTQHRQALVLGGLENVAFQAFQFYPYRIIIAIGPPPVAGLTGVPSAFVSTYKLPELSRAGDEEVR